MEEKLEQLKQRYDELQELIADPDIHKDPKRYKELMQEHSHLSELVAAYDEYTETQQAVAETRELVEQEQDSDMKAMAREELENLEEKEQSLLNKLKIMLVPKDPLDGKDTIVEIRAGTGGDEASLFAANLYRMYSRFAEKNKWKIEVMDQSPTEVGGFKEIVFSVAGRNVYGNLKYESGVHRVQRVPTTESGGRIHTSAVTVAVLPEAEDTDIQLANEDLRIDVFRSSGPGGQSVNTTDSAVRITHIPTGTVVTCQDEKSQHKNKAKALRVLKARLYEAEELRKRQERDTARKSQIGSGDRSERIRTYNFPQNRITDHRINLTLYKLDHVLQGELDEAVEALKLTDREESLKAET
ncbi:MAG: peptide chain release factor 1 [Spirochaetes bacterium]|jgi:peptide chain release factor 1|nr:peptide chain release factor 1 [Spirochaetota bacterium]